MSRFTRKVQTLRNVTCTPHGIPSSATMPRFLPLLKQPPRKSLHTSLNMAPKQSQIIYAPSKESPRSMMSIFLAGTATKDVDTQDWRETLSTSLSDLSVTIYNPFRPDWDSSWREDIDFAPYREQVEWELDRQEKADIVIIYFHPATQAPVSLMEFGLCAKVPGKAIAVCPKGYWKRGNVQIVCKKYGVELLDSIGEVKAAIVKRMPIKETKASMTEESIFL